MGRTVTARAGERRRAREPRGRKSSRVLTAVGLVLILIGLSLFGYLGWQYYGTNVVAKNRQAALTDDLRSEWDKGDQTAAGPKDVTGVALLRIPRFGSDYEVPVVRGFDAQALASGVGMYPDGAEPGQIGNFVLAGHIVTHGQPFEKFKELKAGDTVIVETRDYIYTYVLRTDGDATTVDFNTKWPLNQVPDPQVSGGTQADEAYLTLITCAELFHTENRLVVVGDLVSAEPK